MTKTRTVATYFLGLALFSFAGSLGYLTYTISGVAKMLPDLLDDVSLVLQESDSIIAEVEKVRISIPPILEETARIRSQIPSIIEQVEKISKSIPSILEETALIRTQIPPVVSGLNKASEAVNTISIEIKESRPVVTDFTQELSTIRQAIPPILDKAEVVIQQAEGVGKEAGKDAVLGAITGIVRSPFALVKNVGKTITGLTGVEAYLHNETDNQLIKEASLKACHSQHVGTMFKWNNPDTSNHGMVTLKAINDKSGEECRTLGVESMIKNNQVKENEVEICRKTGGKWYFK
ncbi:MAG: surface antigen [Desulforhopalus sp.]|jgi:surface antigen